MLTGGNGGQMKAHRKEDQVKAGGGNRGLRRR